MHPFVSVIVPCLNRKEWMQEQVRSLLAQTYPPESIEIIAVDNGSTDGLWEWLETESAADHKIPLRCYRNESGRRTGEASRNMGITYARGSILAFTDSDCICAPDWVEKGVAAFRPGVGIVVGQTTPPPGEKPGPLARVRAVGEVGYFDTCNIFYSRETIERAGGFCEDLQPYSFQVFGYDVELGIRVRQAGYAAVYAGDAVVVHRIREQTLWQWLIEPRDLAAVPALVRRHPCVRSDMLFLRYFLSAHTALFNLMLAGFALAAVAGPWWLLSGLPFLFAKAAGGARRLALPLRIVRVAGATARAGVTFAVLAYASLKFRTLVL